MQEDASNNPGKQILPDDGQLPESTNTQYPNPIDSVPTPVGDQNTIISDNLENKSEPEDQKPNLNFFKKYFKQLIIVLAVLLLGLSGFWFYSYQKSKSHVGIVRFKAKTIAFKIVSTDPANNQANVSPKTSIIINFSQPVTPEKLQGNLFVTPNIPGTFSQGANPSQIVFKPSSPFAQGTKVEVMLNGTYQSNQGTKLGANYFYGFTTALPQNGVVFEDQNSLYSTLDSALTNQSQNFTLSFGQNVSGLVAINLYKSNVSQLLSSLVYNQTTSGGLTTSVASSQPVDTSNMVLVSSKLGYQNNQKVSFTENTGVYLVTATDSNGNQLGHVWMDYSDFMLLARQDDQKIVVDAQNFTNTTDVPAAISIYNLNGAVNQINSANINGLTEIPTAYSPSADIIVASDTTSQAIIPLSVVNSQGDIRTDQNLSLAQSFYAITDRPTYSPGDSVQLSGFVRSNQDALYSTNQSPLNFYVGNYQGDKLTTFTATPDSNGIFNSTFKIDPSWFTNNSTGAYYSSYNPNNLNIYASSPGGSVSNDPQVASFSVAPTANNDYNILVNFSKKSYISSDSVSASISVTDQNGKPLSNGTVDVHIFSSDYFENDNASNYYSFGSPGLEISSSPVVVHLDANGQATWNLNVASLPNDGYSKKVSLEVNILGSKSTAAGGDWTIIHQGNGVISFGPSQSMIANNSTLTASAYLTDLSNQPIANQTLNYSLIDTSSNTSINSGTVQTDSQGLGSISIPLNLSGSGTSLQLKVWTTDSNKNVIQSSSYYTVGLNSETQDTSGAVLQDIGVSGVSSNLTVGQQVTLDINSPANLHTMITMDRGRIYHPSMIDLVKGDNKFTFTVTPDLAPSFTLTFNYFENQIFHSEGTFFNVANTSKQAYLSFNMSNNHTVSANTPVSLTIKAENSTLSPLSTNLLIDVVSANTYNLTDQVNPSMYLALYHSLPIMTNSSSSLTAIGSGGGGRCGGGAGLFASYSNPIGSTLLFENISTNSNGTADISFTPPKGSWRVNVYSMSSDTIVGSGNIIVNAN